MAALDDLKDLDIGSWFAPEFKHDVATMGFRRNQRVQRVVYLLSLILGLLGLVGCIAAIVATWSANSRVNRATENAFRAVDDSLIVVRQRVARTQDQIHALRMTTEGIERSIKDWTKQEARERVRSRLGIEDKAERLASGLQQADHWLELTEASVGLVQQTLEAAGSLRAPSRTDGAEHLLEEMGSLRLQLTQAIELVEGICQRTAEADQQDLGADAYNQIVRLAVRVIATLTSIDARLAKLGNQLTEVQAKTRSMKVTVKRWIRIGAAVVTLLVSWMAVGQGSLCYFGWKGLRRR